jgi:hypothetical protein
MNRYVRYQHNNAEWDNIKKALKDKYQQPTVSKGLHSQGQNDTPETHWNHLSRLTGRTRQEIIDHLKKLT